MKTINFFLKMLLSGIWTILQLKKIVLNSQSKKK